MLTQRSQRTSATEAHWDYSHREYWCPSAGIVPFGSQSEICIYKRRINNFENKEHNMLILWNPTQIQTWSPMNTWTTQTTTNCIKLYLCDPTSQPGEEVYFLNSENKAHNSKQILTIQSKCQHNITLHIHPPHRLDSPCTSFWEMLCTLMREERRLTSALNTHSCTGSSSPSRMMGLFCAWKSLKGIIHKSSILFNKGTLIIR